MRKGLINLYVVSLIQEGVSSPSFDRLNVYFVKYNLYKISAIALVIEPVIGCLHLIAKEGRFLPFGSRFVLGNTSV